MNTHKNQAYTEIGYIINEQGEEIAITESMIEKSLNDAETICLGSPDDDAEEPWPERQANRQQWFAHKKMRH